MNRFIASFTAFAFVVFGILMAPLTAQAAALPLPASNAIYYFDYSASSTPLNQITGATSGVLSTSAVCPSASCTGTIGTNAGSFIDAATETLYVASTDTANTFTLQKVPLNGANAGVPVLVGATSLATSVYGIAQGPNGAYALDNQGNLFSINLTNGTTSNIGDTGIGSDTWNGFTYNQADGSFYAMGRGTGDLYRINVTSPSSSALVGTVPSVSSSYSLQTDSSGTFWNLSSSSELRTFTVSGSTISATTSVGSLSSFATTAMAILAPPPTYTVTFQHGTGATGADLVQTISQGSSLTLPNPTACPLTSTNPCFTAPSGQRQNGWVNLAGGPTYYSTGQTITPVSNLTLTARWTGGPVQYSTTSFLSTPNPMSSIAFPNTAVGSSNQITLYAYNSGTASTSISNETIAGNGVSRQGGTCNASGGTIAAGAQCTVILQWNPSAAGALANGSYQMQVSGGYFDSVILTGTAATPYTVTFNPHGGSGTMGTQTSAGPSNLNTNTFTRAGYTFHYWTLFSDGSGTTFNNQASYPFSANQTLFAQWTADSHTVTFNTDGGSVVTNGSFNTDGSMNLPGAPTKSGYTFNGWFASPTGGTALSSPYFPSGTSNITLYAQWSVNSSNSSSGLPHTGTQVENQLGLAGLMFLSGFALIATAYVKRRKI